LTGVPARFLVAQSALESGWGKREIRTADGAPSFNLFGIKAGGRWAGATVEVPTTEFVNGVAQTTREVPRLWLLCRSLSRLCAAV
jgi:flagellar protein FlgJ